ncbi:helix-turn-helix domain-containing protein [Paracoccus sp. SSJ]|uniref:helix-turn-helix domain-containing protein n=1 Tax=Paracoccus sp. SSJ TaxID=3050636 RepID=UPI0033077CF6
MGRHEPMQQPYTPETLAERWGVTANAVRKKCAAGELAHFRFGKLYRIPAHVVQEFENCQTSASVDCAADTASIGPTKASEFGISLRHAPERKRKQKQ